MDFRETMLIFGLMLLKTAACLDRFCSFDQSDPCYTALGHKLNLLMLDSSEYDLKIQKRTNNSQDDPVCRVKNDEMRRSQCDLYNNRSEVTVIKGTLIINPVNRTDSGNYRLTLQNSDGSETSRDLQVIVEAPIGSVEVSITCSSSGVMRVSCSSEGDQLLYSWTLNGDPQKDGNSSIDLDEKSDGDISCSVKNHVSHAQNTTRLKPCPESTTAAATSTLTSGLTSAVTSSTQTSENGSSFSSAGMNPTSTQGPGEFPWKFYLIPLCCSALVMALLLITMCYVYKKKQLKSTPDTELIYTDIHHERKSEKKTESLPAAAEEYATVQVQTKRRKKNTEEDEVQYGEVTFRPNDSMSPQVKPTWEECVYAQVQRR
ncbi:uncharacterized protein LOC122335342 [Puntigrus tetrazona]|uniref:uncharacterized protein LOC122335342 n=1 Tax=Puntigrus tetrazona TaxID=1606681 RepID=UPI001C88F8C7|nr:uncharacterized protein LOC122335342 [Puntigrus tetrazona]